jgi:hypothetical protein
MTFLPIVDRELRVRARGKGTYWVRFGAGLIGMLICLPQLAASGPLGGGGKPAFDGLVVAAFLLSCSACLLTAESLGSEQRDGTLGLLFLTRVTGLDVLVGKLGSGGISLLCALTAFTPVLVIPLLAGGVNGGEVFRKIVALLNALFLSLAAGLWSASSPRGKVRAAASAFALVAAVVIVPIALPLMLPTLNLSGNTALVVKALSPLRTLFCAAENEYRAFPAGFWTSLALVHGAAWFFLFGAARRLRLSVREEGIDDNLAEVQDAGQVLPARVQRRWGLERTNRSPIEYLVWRQRGARAALWIAAIVSVVYQTAWHVWFPFLGRGTMISYSLLAVQVPGLTVAVVKGALMAWAASRFFVEARRSGELELLLTTPVGAGTLVADQWRALKQLLWGPVVVMLAAVLLRAALLMSPGFTPTTSGMIYLWSGYRAASVLLGAVDTVLLVGAEPTKFNLGESMSSLGLSAADTLRRARRWAPSAPGSREHKD